MTWNPMSQTYEPATLTLADFLLARSQEKFDRDWGALIDSVGAPPEVGRDVVAAKLRGTTAGAMLGLRKASRDLAITGAYSTPLAKTRALRKFALPYADHPDYREEWRP